MLFKHRCGLIIEQYQKKHADPKHWKVFAGFSMAASLFADLGGSITPNVETFNTMLLSTKGRNHLSGFVPNFMAECVSCGRCVCDVTQLKRKDACCCQEWWHCSSRDLVCSSTRCWLQARCFDIPSSHQCCLQASCMKYRLKPGNFERMTLWVWGVLTEDLWMDLTAARFFLKPTAAQEGWFGRRWSLVEVWDSTPGPWAVLGESCSFPPMVFMQKNPPCTMPSEECASWFHPGKRKRWVSSPL